MREEAEAISPLASAIVYLLGVGWWTARKERKRGVEIGPERERATEDG